MSAKIAYEFWKKRSTIISVCWLSCEKLKETGILIDKPKHEKSKTVRTTDNIAAVAESKCEAPSTSIHRRSQQLNIWRHHWDEYCIKTLIWCHKKSNWCRSSSQLTIHSVFASLNRPAFDLQKMPILAKKLSFHLKLTLILAGMSRSKIVAFGAPNTRMHTLKNRLTQNESLFGADFGPES